MNNIKDIIDFVERSNYFLVTSHINPDGDNVGSTLSMYLALKNLGKEVYYVLDDTIPKNISFLTDDINILKSDNINIKNYSIITLDCGDKKRICIEDKLIENAQKLINIDHHISNDFFGDYNYVDSDGSSTCELVYNLLSKYELVKNKNIIDEKIATCLYTGLLTDTGNFMYQSTKETSFDMAKNLIKRGANKDLIIQKVFQSNSFNYYKLLGEALNTLKVYNNKVALISVTKEMMEKNDISFSDVDGIASYTRDIEGIEVGILLKQKDENEVKVSLRSKSYVDVSEIAKSLGGGGHKRASGCTIYDSVDNTINKVIECVLKAI